MTDATEPTTESELDVEAEKAKLDDLGERIEKTRHHAEEDMEPGGEGRVFADEGVRSQVEHGGDTHHDRAD